MRSVDVAEFAGAEPFAVDALPVFPGSVAPRRPLTEVELRAANRMTRSDRRRALLDATACANAVREIAALPAAGESLHCVMRGNFHFWSIVPAVVRLARPARVAMLHVATLGTNRANTANLCKLLDAGDVARVAFLASKFFRDQSASIWGQLKGKLEQRGHRAAAVRNHAKIVLFQLTDGRAIVVEGSANMRSCNNLEQFAMIADRALLDFHARWIDEAIANEATLNAKG